MTADNQKEKRSAAALSGNADREDNDKAPGEEQGKSEIVTPADLKGKKVDADPSSEDGRPIDIKKSEEHYKTDQAI